MTKNGAPNIWSKKGRRLQPKEVNARPENLPPKAKAHQLDKAVKPGPTPAGQRRVDLELWAEDGHLLPAFKLTGYGLRIEGSAEELAYLISLLGR